MAKGKNTYENKLNDLENLILKMESEEVSLEESISNYEKGIKLSNELYKILKDYENKIKILLDGKEEEFEKEE